MRARKTTVTPRNLKAKRCKDCGNTLRDDRPDPATQRCSACQSVASMPFIQLTEEEKTVKPLIPRPSACAHCLEGAPTDLPTYVREKRRAFWLDLPCRLFALRTGMLPLQEDDHFIYAHTEVA